MATKEGPINLNLLFIFMCFFCAIQSYSSLAAGESDTIKQGEVLNSSNSLVSAGRKFRLGFFSPGDDPNNIYLGIWYINDDTVKKVWVANREMPIAKNSSTLTIDSTGLLKLTSNESSPIVLNSDRGTGNVTATLLDSGNFILTDEMDEKRVLWESFDYPTNTLLPGMKLGVNLKTGQNWSLNSWVSTSFPASGAFTLSWDITEQLIIRRRGELYWTSGYAVLKNQSFEFMPVLNAASSKYFYNLSFVSNEDEKYFTFNASDQSTPWWELTPGGRIMDDGNGVELNLQQDEFCYGYASNDGCAKSKLPGCRSRNDKFEQRRASFRTGTTIATDGNSSLSLSDCWAKCWNDCNCVGFINSSSGLACVFWSGKLKFYEDNINTVPIYVLLHSDEKEIMSIDRSWMQRRLGVNGIGVSPEFRQGVIDFLDFAFSHPQFVDENKIKCPCRNCECLYYRTRDEDRYSAKLSGVASTVEGSTTHQVDDLELWKECTGGVKKGKIIGFGSRESARDILAGSSSSQPQSSNAQMRQDQFDALRAEMRQEMRGLLLSMGLQPPPLPEQPDISGGGDDNGNSNCDGDNGCGSS